MKPWVVIRSHNDFPIIAETLAMVCRQTGEFELLAQDNESTDGTLYELKKYTDRIVTMPKVSYAPGRMLNRGMELSEGETVVFLCSAWQTSLIRYSLLPYIRQVLSDWKHCMAAMELSAAAQSPVLRLAQMFGRRAGLRAELRERSKG
jgi:hypothetical protein